VFKGLPLVVHAGSRQARSFPFNPEKLRSFLAAVWELVRPGDEPGL